MQGLQEYEAAYEQVLRQMPKPSATVDVHTRYGSVRTYEWASEVDPGATPVVLMPGIRSGAPMWRDNLPALLGPQRIIAVDPLGDANLSQQSVPITSMSDQTAWLDDVLDELVPGAAVHLVGHSFGAATAAAYASAHPDRVTSLTLLEPVVTLAGLPLSIYLWSAIILLPTPQSWRDEALRRIGGTDDEPADPEEAKDPLVRMIDVGAREYSAQLPMPKVLDDSQLAALTMPVYVGIGGKDSLAGGAAAADKARTHLPRATVKVWPDATHSLPMQVPEALGRELLAFWDAAE